MTTIRPATEADIPGIRAVGAAAWRDTYPGLVPDGYIEAGLAQGWARERFVADLADPAQRLIVAEDGGQIVGLAHTRRIADGGGQLWRLYLAREARGRGLGRALWQAARDAHDTPLARWETSVIVGNPALHFYRHLGFRPVREATWAAFGYEVPLIWLQLGTAALDDARR